MHFRFSLNEHIREFHNGKQIDFFDAHPKTENVRFFLVR